MIDSASLAQDAQSSGSLSLPLRTHFSQGQVPSPLDHVHVHLHVQHLMHFGNTHTHTHNRTLVSSPARPTSDNKRLDLQHDFCEPAQLTHSYSTDVFRATVHHSRHLRSVEHDRTQCLSRQAPDTHEYGFAWAVDFTSTAQTPQCLIPKENPPIRCFSGLVVARSTLDRKQEPRRLSRAR